MSGFLVQRENDADIAKRLLPIPSGRPTIEPPLR